jgi:hypothetical protein
MWIKLLEIINRWTDGKLSKIYRHRFYDAVKKYLIDKNIPFVIEDKSYESPEIFLTVLQKDYEYVHGLTAYNKKGSPLEWIGYGLNVCTEETMEYLIKTKYYANSNRELIGSNMVVDMNEDDKKKLG